MGSHQWGLFGLPAAILLLLVVAYPIVRTVALSFSDMGLSNEFQMEWTGLGNFRRLFSDSRFASGLKATTVFTITSVTLEFVIGLGLALAASEFVRGRGLIRSIFLAPWTLPTAIIAVLWSWIFNDQYGIVNGLLQKAHLLESPIAWLGTPGTAMGVLVLADVWKTTPFVFVVLLAGLQSVPQDLYEAIEMDGGGMWPKFRYVTLPFLLPFLFIALIFRLIQAFAVFDLVYVMTGGGPGGATETVSVYSYRTYMRYLDIGYGSAQVVAMILILCIVAIAMYQLLVKRHERTF
ncbi:MAG: sugar ABC transporter permease [Acidobacteria bacterium]|nr:sugar ABC transporter permease [Acidobacteriota bacterium]